MPAAARRYFLPVLMLAALAAGGCAARRKPAALPPRDDSQPAAATQPATVPAVVSTEALPLDQILPRAELPKPATRPATAPASDRAPLEALELYARAVDELRAHRRQSAAALLEKAVALDPHSFELHYALGRAYLPGGGHDDRSIAALSRAAELKPDDLDVQTELGRQLVAKGETEKGLWHLRLAALTPKYADGDPAGAATELYLGRALARAGYHAAAVEVYGRLDRRLQNPTSSLRAQPEVAYLLVHPELLRLQTAESYERLGRHEQALAAYEAVLARDPSQRALLERVVRSLVALRRFDDAAARAAAILAASGGDAASVDPLRDVARAAGEDSPVALLERLRRRRPDDRNLLLAHADVLRLDGRPADAWAALSEAATRLPADADLLDRLYRTAWDMDPTGAGAARFIVERSAGRPEVVHVLERFVTDLIRPTRTPRLGLRFLMNLKPPEGEASDTKWEAAKQYWVWHVAQLRHRRDVAREALRRGVDSQPPFPPAWRVMVDSVWEQPGSPPGQKAREVGALAARADAAGDGPLASEVRGLSLLHQGRLDAARGKFAEAVRVDAPAPELRLAHAASLRDAGDFAGFERAAWKLVGEWPRFENGYEGLYRHHDARGEAAQAAKVLGAWVTADGGNVSARLLEVREYLRLGQPRAAVTLMGRLLSSHPEDGRVLVSARALYTQAGQLDAFVADLQQRHSKQPANLVIAAQLADVFTEQRRAADAARVLDATRAAVGGGSDADPDLLYEVAHLYTMTGQSQASEQVLRDVVKLDPGHAAASNDLGYVLADEGRDLEAAEAMTRRAVDAEPKNGSFLDSLGWVLYKRGRLEEARQALGRAVELSDAPGPDPVVLDHLGDALYQLGDAAAAADHWKRAVKRLGEMPDGERQRDELAKLRLRLDRKTRQADAGQPVSVAPVVEKPLRRPPSASQPAPAPLQSRRQGVQ